MASRAWTKAYVFIPNLEAVRMRRRRAKRPERGAGQGGTEVQAVVRAYLKQECGGGAGSGPPGVWYADSVAVDGNTGFAKILLRENSGGCVQGPNGGRETVKQRWRRRRRPFLDLSAGVRVPERARMVREKQAHSALERGLAEGCQSGDDGGGVEQGGASRLGTIDPPLCRCRLLGTLHVNILSYLLGPGGCALPFCGHNH
ncbi:hypothetical protein FB45DRAFT_875771 [Roridomyces roridus]|uniref:Uncharacterized protein n=1 Tax=Roridomyces roridus TaxID=1738132 RepID=A0AAD7B5B1_9AGAR|nr:hypothetical protein FB45DRAFT_875771 [Roridomyces roridus]